MITIKSHVTLLIIFLLTALDVSAQSVVLIKGKFKPTIENTSVSVYKPVAGNFNMTYPDGQSETAVESGEFKVKLALDVPGFIRLQSKGMPKTYFYAEPGGSIQIAFLKDAGGNITTIYSGSNADANNLLASNSPMGNYDFLQTTLPSFFQTESAEMLVELFVQEIKKSTIPLEMMLKKGKITKSCYEAMLREAEQTMLHWTNSYLKNYFITDEELRRVTKLSRGEMKNFAQKVYDMYDPYDEKYGISTRTYNNSLVKSILIEDGAINSNRAKTELWSQFAKEFSMIVSRLPAIDYAPDSVQMSFIGTSLLSAIMFKPMSNDDFIRIFNTYYNKFPRSPYNSIITAYLSENAKTTEQVTTKSEFGLYLVQSKTDSLIEQDLAGIDKITSIQALIKKHFQGSPVFVDFWATWCSPCIAEFQNEPILSEFLEREKIATLYVSIDSKAAMANWKKSIKKYQLGGYHYLANQEIRGNLDKWFFGIPRYMLFNSKGDLESDNLPRPSSKEELFGQIIQLLKE